MSPLGGFPDEAGGRFPAVGKCLLGKEGQISLHLPNFPPRAGMEDRRWNFILEVGWEVKRGGVLGEV